VRLRRCWVPAAVVGLLALLPGGAVRAASIPPPAGPLVDAAQVLSVQTRASLTQELSAYNASSRGQIAVLTVQTTAPQSIEAYALAAFNAWGVGHAQNNDGVLMVVGVADHKVRIQTGSGLGRRLDDQGAADIVDGDVVPKFRSGDFDGGVMAGVAAVRQALDASASTGRRAGSNSAEEAVLFAVVLAVVVLGLLALLARFGTRPENRRPGWRGWFPLGITGRGGGGGGGGGGADGFGGGASSGGGATGSW